MREKKNILILSEHYSPRVNGVQNKTQQLAEFLVNQAYTVSVISAKDKNTSVFENINGVNVQRIPLKTRYTLHVGDSWAYENSVTSRLKSSDLVFLIAAENAFTDIAINIILKQRKKAIIYFHGMAHFGFPNVTRISTKDILRWLINNLRWRFYYYRMRDKFQCLDASIHLHEKDMTFGLIKSNETHKKFIIENTCKSQIRKSSQESYILSVSNYSRDKNQKFVLKSYYLSKAEKPLVFVGSEENSYLSELKDLKVKYDNVYGEKDVFFIVGESREKTLDRYRQASLFLLGSKHEKYPTVIAEAMGVGLPWVCTDVGVVKHLRGGLVVQSIEEMAISIDRLMGDVKYAENLSRDGHEYSQHSRGLEDSLIELLVALDL